MEETKFMITPSELDVKNLFAYLCKYCSFNDVMELYKLLKYNIENILAYVENETKKN